MERQKVNMLSVPQAREKEEREGCKRKNRRKKQHKIFSNCHMEGFRKDGNK